jgi:hypothetical protein
MKTNIVVLVVFLVIASFIGFLWKKNNLKIKIASETSLKPLITELDGLTYKGSNKEQIAEWNAGLIPFRQKAKEFGFTDDEIDNEIMRRFNMATDNENPTPTLTNPICKNQRSNLLTDALSKGASANDLKEIAAIYDLICTGKTDIDISETSQDNTGVNYQQNNYDKNIKQDCQEDQIKYSSCLTEYNTKMIEYQSCLSCKANEEFGCGLACIKPSNNCNQYKIGPLCNIY